MPYYFFSVIQESEQITALYIGSTCNKLISYHLLTQTAL